MPRSAPLTAIYRKKITYGSVHAGAQLGVPAPKFVHVGTASETDSAGTIIRTHPVIGATEADTAGAFGRRKTRALGIAAETDTSGTITAFRVLGVAAETDTAGTITVTQATVQTGELVDTIGVAWDDPDFS